MKKDDLILLGIGRTWQAAAWAKPKLAQTKDFFRSGLFEMGGYFKTAGTTDNFQGWGTKINAKTGVKTPGGSIGYGPSGVAAGLTGISVISGLYNEGLIGGVKMAGAELLQSSVMAELTSSSQYIARSVKVGAFKASLPMTIGSMIGGIAGTKVGEMVGLPTAGYAIGSSLGAVGGAAIAAAPPQVQLVAGLIGAVVGAGYAAYKGAEFAVNSSYGLMKNGLAYRREKLTSIETSGSTAAFMNKAAFTMRSRAVQAINKHQMNARSALGQEATIGHFNAYRKYSYNMNY